MPAELVLRRTFTPIHNKPIQNIATVKNGQRDKRGTRDGMLYNTLKAKIMIGIKEPIITENASIPLRSSLIGRKSKLIAPATKNTGRATNINAPNE
jgi:hypothetical protein